MTTPSCWDCHWFKKRGLCCPTHGTPEEKKAAAEVTHRRLVEWAAYLDREKKERP